MIHAMHAAHRRLEAWKETVGRRTALNAGSWNRAFEKSTVTWDGLTASTGWQSSGGSHFEGGGWNPKSIIEVTEAKTAQHSVQVIALLGLVAARPASWAVFTCPTCDDAGNKPKDESAQVVQHLLNPRDLTTLLFPA